MPKAMQIKRLERLERQQAELLDRMDRQHNSGDYNGLKRTMALAERLSIKLGVALRAVT